MAKAKAKILESPDGLFEDDDNLLKKIGKAEADKLARLVSMRFRGATADLRELIDDSREGWDFYLKNQPNLDNEPGGTVGMIDSQSTNTPVTRRGLRMGLIPKAVNAVVSLLHNSIFPADEQYFRGTPKNDVARQMQNLYEQYRQDNYAEDNTTEEMRKLILTLCIDSAAAIALPWQSRKRDKVVYEAPSLKLGGIEVPLPVLGLKKKTLKDYVEWEGTHAQCLDFNDWRADTTARSMKDSWFIRRWYEPCWKVEEEYDLKDVEPYYDYEERIEDSLGTHKRESSGLYLPIPYTEEEEGKKEALLMVCYDDFEIKGKVYKNHVALTLNGAELIWFGKNPYQHGRIPYVVHSLLPIPNQVYGQTLIKHAIPSAAVVDTATDRILKIGTLAADPIFEVDMMEPAFRKSRLVKPGMTVPVKRVGNAIRQVPVNIANLSSLMQLIEMAEDNIREVTGANQMIMGEDVQQPTNTTAFSVDQHMQGANSRFQAIMSNFNNNVLEPMLYITFENDKQYKTKTEYVAIGDKTTELTPDLIKQMEMKWLITSVSAANNKGKRLANAMGLLTNIIPPMVKNGAAQLAPSQPIFDIPAILRQIMVLGGEPNADLYFKEGPPPPPPMPPMAPQPPMPQPMQGPPNGVSPIPQPVQPGPGQVPAAPQA